MLVRRPQQFRLKSSHGHITLMDIGGRTWEGTDTKLWKRHDPENLNALHAAGSD